MFREGMQNPDMGQEAELQEAALKKIALEEALNSHDPDKIGEIVEWLKRVQSNFQSEHASAEAATQADRERAKAEKEFYENFPSRLKDIQNRLEIIAGFPGIDPEIIEKAKAIKSIAGGNESDDSRLGVVCEELSKLLDKVKDSGKYGGAEYARLGVAATFLETIGKNFKEAKGKFKTIDWKRINE